MHPVAVAGAIVALVATIPALWWAWINKVDTCDSNDCGNVLFEIQFLVALFGLGPAVTLVYAVSTGRRRLAAYALTLGIVTYALWAILNNDAVQSAPQAAVQQKALTCQSSGGTDCGREIRSPRGSARSTRLDPSRPS
jgi:hypothetical protein